MLLAKEELIEFEGSVLELLPDARFRVKLDNGHETLAYSSGRMKKNRIRILAGEEIGTLFVPSGSAKRPSRSRWIGSVRPAGTIVVDDGTARALVDELQAGQALLTTAGPLPVGAQPELVVRLVNGVIE